jgi:hypothetical protein
MSRQFQAMPIAFSSQSSWRVGMPKRKATKTNRISRVAAQHFVSRQQRQAKRCERQALRCCESSHPDRPRRVAHDLGRSDRSALPNDGANLRRPELADDCAAQNSTGRPPSASAFGLASYLPTAHGFHCTTIATAIRSRRGLAEGIDCPRWSVRPIASGRVVRGSVDDHDPEFRAGRRRAASTPQGTRLRSC